MLAIRLSDEIESRLDSLAKQTGRNKDVLCGSNTGASGRPEDYYLSAETAARVRRVMKQCIRLQLFVRKSLLVQLFRSGAQIVTQDGQKQNARRIVDFMSLRIAVAFRRSSPVREAAQR